MMAADRKKSVARPAPLGSDPAESPFPPAGEGAASGPGDAQDGAAERWERFSVLPGEEGLRLDLFLAGKAVGLSRTQVQRAAEAGRVLVNDRPARAGRKLKAGETLTLRVPAPEPLATLPEAIPLTILYEDPCLLVIDKPAGMVVHPAAGHAGGTLVNALLHHCRDLSGIGGVLRPGIVHRLDKETSGLLVVAKSDDAHRGLADQFKRHAVKKTYLAIVYGDPPAAEGRIEAAVGRHPTDRKRMSTHSRRGKDAVSLWRVRERFGAAALLEVAIETGRTHQIRVHLTALGHPVVGDRVYGSAGKVRTAADSRLRKEIAALGRQALHAWRLGFSHPLTGERLAFEAPLPPDMEALCAFLRERGEG
jgi:23S rRNA pseudouridine1911/1915/1917 synthase